MATNNLSSKIILEPLTYYNYEDWSAWMKNYLLAQDLWDIVEGTGKPEDDFKAWRKNNAAALHAILISCEVDILSKIRKISSAKIVWEKLASMYGPDRSCGGYRNYSTTVAYCMAKNLRIFQEAEHVEPPEVSLAAEDANNNLLQYEHLITAVKYGDWDYASHFLSEYEDAKRARISIDGGTVLHVAVFAGCERIVEKLVELMSEEELQIKDYNCMTALAQATILQNTRMVDCMLRKTITLLNIRDKENRIPLIAALEFGTTEMARYLYSASLPCQILSDIDGSTVLTLFILRNRFDLALHLLKRKPSAAILPNMYNTSPLAALASKPSAFPSGNKLVFWENWIYACIPIRTEHSTNETFINIRHIEPQSNREEISIPELGQLRRPTSNLLKLLGFKKIYEMKLLHHQACQLLDQMCNQVEQMNLNHVNRAIFQAIKGGIIEFIVAILKKDFQLLNTIDAMKRDTFFCAVLHRQEKIFDLLCMHNARNSITNAVDRFGCTILHMAATLEPCTTRDRISGEALKMQSEVQWFKKVEKIFPPQLHEIRNNTNMTARELFTHNHKKMMKEGETWTKETASACIMVGGLIITIMFTAAFTVPGGNDQNTGFPMFSDKTLFTVFTIFDALSLLFASVSVLIFLGSITSRYAEEDFFKFLPSNMIIGHYTLFFSIATMMIAFCAGLFIMVHGKLWIVIPAICLAFGTVYKFASMLLPLFDHMLKRMSTHELGTRYLRRWFKANNFDK